MQSHMIARRQRVYKTGTSQVIAIPKPLVTGSEATLAGNRLLLVDPRGEISETVLLDFMERILEPALYGPEGLLSATPRTIRDPPEAEP